MLALAMSMKVDNRIICFLSGLTLLELGTCKAIKHLLAVPAPNSLRGRTIRGSMVRASSLSPGTAVSVVEYASKLVESARLRSRERRARSC